MVSWQQQDQLGRTTLLRSYAPDDSDWSLKAEISLTYDTADRLTEVYRRDGGEGRWQRTSSVNYDFAGRKTGMSDADLGSWRYAYNSLGQLTRQTDARDNTSCLYYDSLGRMKGRVQRTDESCATGVADAALDSVYSYDPQGRVQSVAHGLVSRSNSYDSYSRLNRETVTIDGLTRSSSYSYDSYHRPTAVTYHGGEVVTTEYGSPGVAVGLSSSVHGDLVDNVSYDEAGRMTALRLPAAGGLWRTQSYYPWTVKRNGGMLESLKVGLSEGGGERLSRSYAYNSFGDITALTEETTSYTFGYDGLGRLTSAYGRTYSYDGASRLTTFNGQSYGYGDAGPYHAVDRIGDFDRFDYDANGNMVTRNKGLDSQQTLVWNAENRLSEVQDNDRRRSRAVQVRYRGRQRASRRRAARTTTYTFFGHYEEEVTGGTTTAISHYSFGGLRIAVKRGSTLYHLHGDHLGSTSLTTAGSVVEASRAYYAYGAERAATGDLQTDRTFTGQKRDATGLMYYNARYYDPALGTFISPDSLVPNQGMVIDYNRFLYARGNPLKYTDPSGHAYDPGGGSGTDECSTKACWEEKWYWNNRWYKAHGFGWSDDDGHWTVPIRPIYEDTQILHDVIREDLVGWLIREMKGNTQDERLKEIAGLNKLSEELRGGLGLSPVRLAAKAVAYGKWAILVGPGMPWDYKKHIGDAVGYGNYYGGKSYYYDAWANINYGYAGRAAGFTHEELLKGAGMGQIASDLVTDQTVNYGMSSNFDDPADQAAVRIGMALYDQYGLNIDEDKFRQAFQREARHLTIWP